MEKKACSRCATEKSIDEFYKNKNGKFQAQCKKCRIAGVIRSRKKYKARTGKDYDSHKVIRDHPCKRCGKIRGVGKYNLRKGLQLICGDCQRTLAGRVSARISSELAALRRAARPIGAAAPEDRYCIDCRNIFAAESNSKAMYCIDCRYGRNRLPEEEREERRKQRSRRKRERRKAISRKLRWDIYARDEWTCQLCLEAVDKTLPSEHTWGPTLDHIQCKAWTPEPNDSPENLRLAHRYCNSLRGDETWWTFDIDGEPKRQELSMGKRGPSPKDGPLHGHRATVDSAGAIPIFTGDFPEGSEPSRGIPEASKSWHPVARELYNSALESRTTKYYEPVDYILLFTACEQVSRSLKPRIVGSDPETGDPIYAKVPMSGSELQGVLKFFTQLGMSVTDRRRIEVDIRQPNEDKSRESERQAEAVANMDAYRKAMRPKSAG